ncbi:hypothetical protein [Reichenbachiella ulvae]|uniref:Uncharacterized protein n=1 Tax=Reichenbachiella ulvae TaxID=2980104 RepID=A0ABT3CTH5_9BACT|nr:hypothetical protein [Reichenbachiella ulvae]MCV9386973.1 hypothetical protein [Reichenbachiella ulvae]
MKIQKLLNIIKPRYRRKFTYHGTFQQLSDELRNIKGHMWSKKFIYYKVKGNGVFKVYATISLGTLTGMGFGPGINAKITVEEAEPMNQKVTFTTPVRIEHFFTTGLFFILPAVMHYERLNFELLFSNFKDWAIITGWFHFVYRAQELILIDKIKSFFKTESTDAVQSLEVNN